MKNKLTTIFAVMLLAIAAFSPIYRIVAAEVTLTLSDAELLTTLSKRGVLQQSQKQIFLALAFASTSLD